MQFKNVKEFKGHSAAVYSLAYDNQFIYSASADKFVTRWNIESGEQDKFALQLDASAYSIELVNDSQQLVVGLSSGLFYVIDLKNRKVLQELDLQASIFVIKSNEIKGQFYCGDANGVLTVFDAQSFQKVLAQPLNCGKIRRFSLNKDASVLAVACQDGFIRLLDTTFYNEIAKFQAHDGGVSALLFDQYDPTILYSGGKDAILRKWNWTKLAIEQEIPAHNYVIYDLLQLSENQLITASRDKTIKIFSLPKFVFKERLDLKTKGHRHSVNALLKINEHLFVSASDDKRIILWQANEQ